MVAVQIKSNITGSKERVWFTQVQSILCSGNYTLTNSTMIFLYILHVKKNTHSSYIMSM